MSPKLGTLYQKYLRGSDLNGAIVPVLIQAVFQVIVNPPPAYSEVEKWCLKVQGLPEGYPNLILFGPKGEKELTAIFGRVEIANLDGKTIDLHPKQVKVAGKRRISIVFEKHDGSQEVQSEQEDPPALPPDYVPSPPPEDDEIPF